VVDYDALTWALPKVLAVLGGEEEEVRGGGSGEAAAPALNQPRIQCHYASFHAFSALVARAAAKVRAAEAAAAAAAEGAVPAGGAGGAAAAPPSSIHSGISPSCNSKHGIDSDSEDEWESSEKYATAFAARVGAADEGGGGCSGSSTPLEVDCRTLGIPTPQPTEAYIYSLRRRLGGKD